MKTRPYGSPWPFAAIITNLAFGLLCAPLGAAAQDTLPVPDGFNEPKGFIAEPAQITRAAIWADRHLGKGDLTNGFYVERGKMIPGAGWLSAGPGYRKWFGRDTLLLDGSAGISWNGYKTAQARAELPKFARSRLALGAQVRWLDYGNVDYFGVGPDTGESALTQFGITATHVAAHATLRPTSWFDIDAQVGVLSPTLQEGPLVSATTADQPTFIPTEVSMTIDTRNFPEHPTKGLLLRGAASHYEDRDSGAFTHQRVEGEMAGYLPMAGERVVLMVHSWIVSTPRDHDTSVPFYLLPSLGGSNSLRSFADYRFHDRNMLVANAELRLAMMTHVDLALFADAGNVAARVHDLNLDKQSYGAGLRFHTRRQTFARVDVAQGSEGWRVLFRLTDPFALSRLERRAAVVPFVP